MARPLSPRALLQTFVDERRAQRYSSEAGIRHVAYALPRLFAYLKANGVDDLKAVTQAHLTAYAHELARQRTWRGTRLASATRSVQIGAIRRFFAFLERRGVLFQNPAAHLPYPRKRRIPGPVMSEAQAERLMETPPATTRSGQRDRAVLELLYGTGVRIGECARTNVCSTSPRDGSSSATARDAKTGWCRSRAARERLSLFT
jgi:site-specific recombinase XerD